MPERTTPWARHLQLLRVLTVLHLLLTTAVLVAVFFLPRRESMLASPTTITLIAAAMGLWFAATAGRDARHRLEVIKLGFEIRGELPKLLRSYVLVYVVVLLRLQSLSICGLLIAVWGRGPVMAVPMLVVGLLLIARAWPTNHKLALLLDRVGVLSESA